MTDYHEVLDECQRLADYWMNEQDVYDVEVTPVKDEYRLTTTLRENGHDITDWYDSLEQVDEILSRFLEKVF